MCEEKTLNNKDIDFLLQVSSKLMEESEPQKLVEGLNKVFKSYYPVRKMSFMVWDETASSLRDFSKEWVIVGSDTRNKLVTSYFERFKKEGKNKFFFNGEFFDYDSKIETIHSVCDLLNQEFNIMYFPLLVRGETIGIIEVQFDGINEDIVCRTNFLDLLHLAMIQISSIILNLILKDQMEIGINFYEAMKDIAKIIESQYELAYIIPLIGEMIDRFISAHLIYIFIKNKDDKFELLWPNACKDKEVLGLLKKIDLKTEYIISDNSKIGVFPLINENTILGAIVAYSNIDKLMQKEIEYLLQLSKQSSTTIQRANVYAEVLKHATLDALTGLNNRRQFEMRLNQEIATNRRKNTPLCAMMLDVDYFKKVNDTYGHAAGDCVLKAVSQLILKELREYDIASRYGGEEFFILLPQTNIEEASFVAQRLKKTIEDSKMDISEAKIPNVNHLKITVSIGVSSFEPDETAEDIYHNADKALYEAKNRGRNKVVVFNRQCECDSNCPL